MSRAQRVARKRTTWRGAFLWSALAMWTPLALAALLNSDLRGSWHDLWFWPGALPGSSLLSDPYDEWLAPFALANLLAWTLLTRFLPRTGTAGALTHGTLTALYLSALAAL